MSTISGDYSIDFEVLSDQDPFVDSDWTDFEETMRLKNGSLHGALPDSTEHIIYYSADVINQNTFSAQFEIKGSSADELDWVGLKFFINNGSGYYYEAYGGRIRIYRQPSGTTSYDVAAEETGVSYASRSILRLTHSYDSVEDETTLVGYINDTEILSFVDTSPIRPGGGDFLRVGIQAYRSGNDEVGFYAVGIFGLVDNILVEYTGSGGLELSGEATIDFVDVTNVLVSYTGDGGITLSGAATVEFIDAGVLVTYVGNGGFALTGVAAISSTVFFTASGGLILAGSAQIQNVPANPYSANERWTTNTALAASFLYFRLLHQKNPLASRDKIEYIEGTEPEVSWDYPVNCVYNSTTGEVSIYSEVSEPEVLFTTLGITKLDITFDINGRPVVVYQLDDEIWMYEYDTVFEEFSQFKIADGVTPFVCWDERRAEYVATGDILVIYKRDNSVFMRRSRDDYLVEFATSLMNLVNPFEIEGFGMTTTHRMQIRIRSTRMLEN